jgi:hypothetical protein
MLKECLSPHGDDRHYGAAKQSRREALDLKFDATLEH